MIKVTFQAGMGLIYNEEDWYELRSKFRIVGEFFGSTKTSKIAFPLALSPEQVYLLKKKGVIELVQYLKLLNEPTADDTTKYNEYIRNSYEEQKVLLRDERKKQIESNIEKIMKGKKSEKSREDVIKEELNKLPELEIGNIISPIYTEHLEFLKGPSSEVVSKLTESTTKIKCLVFEDLWEKKYYVTSGRKFGGDFLVYLGDPVLFHAVFIVKCVESETVNVSEIVSLGRLGHSVKKKFVLANVNSNEQVSYITTDWFDSD